MRRELCLLRFPPWPLCPCRPLSSTVVSNHVLTLPPIESNTQNRTQKQRECAASALRRRRRRRRRQRRCFFAPPPPPPSRLPAALARAGLSLQPRRARRSDLSVPLSARSRPRRPPRAAAAAAAAMHTGLPLAARVLCRQAVGKDTASPPPRFRASSRSASARPRTTTTCWASSATRTKRPSSRRTGTSCCPFED